jgi:hypothetical protein
MGTPPNKAMQPPLRIETETVTACHLGAQRGLCAAK